ncbi:MAG: hypothetical protein U0586_15130 [Candidatus Brocadiaceae bacterium]
MLTTTAMIKTGKVYGNLMVDLRSNKRKAYRPRPAHYHDRLPASVVTRRKSSRCCIWRIQGSHCYAKLGLDYAEAKKRLDTHGGFVRKVLQ